MSMKVFERSIDIKVENFGRIMEQVNYCPDIEIVFQSTVDS
jgi:hypothetical protein